MRKEDEERARAKEVEDGKLGLGKNSNSRSTKPNQVAPDAVSDKERYVEHLSFIVTKYNLTLF